MALSQSKIPPQEREGLLDVVDDGECLRAHIEFRLWSRPGSHGQLIEDVRNLFMRLRKDDCGPC